MNLIPELDALRNKELTFWAVILWKSYGKYWEFDYEQVRFVMMQEENPFQLRYMITNNEDWQFMDPDEGFDYSIIWHPLTQARLYKLNREHRSMEVQQAFDLTLDVLDKNIEFMDKTEIEWMEDEELRSKLLPSLLKFAKHF